MREAFSKCLVESAAANPNLYLLTGDHGYALFDGIRKAHPERFINAGVAEQNMVGVAAGLAKCGFLPVIYGLSCFVPIRVLEQIKIDFCYENLPGIFVGDGAGVVYSHLGTSHQSTEDIACLRAIPNMQILSPADRFEMQSCFQLALNAKAPVYLRMGKSDLGAVHSSIPNIKAGELLPVLSGTKNFGFVATGSMVINAKKLATTTFEGAPVWSAPCIKPLRSEAVMSAIENLQVIFVLEEHSVYGGLGSLLAEISARHRGPQVICIGIKDKFSQLCGTYQYLMKEHQLDFESIQNTIAKFI